MDTPKKFKPYGSRTRAADRTRKGRKGAQRAAGTGGSNYMQYWAADSFQGDYGMKPQHELRFVDITPIFGPLSPLMKNKEES